MRFGFNLWILPTVVSSAFVISQEGHPWTRSLTHNSQGSKTSLFSSTPASDAARLLQKARELRAQALLDEHQVHVALADKQAAENVKIDQLIDYLFFDQTGGPLVDRLHKKRLSIDTLEKIVDRLDEREVVAEGKEHVHLVIKDGVASFERASVRNEQELMKIQGKIEELIEGVSVLDEEFRQEKSTKGEAYVAHTEDQHWGSDRRAERLTNRAHEIRREREEQFQKRLEEFYEAQKIKKGKPPPPKVKDDHGLVP